MSNFLKVNDSFDNLFDDFFKVSKTCFPVAESNAPVGSSARIIWGFVAIARAIVNNPDIILADEPTGALDSKTSVQIMELLKSISNKKLIIMVTHNPELADKYSTRIVRMLDGIITSDNGFAGMMMLDDDNMPLDSTINTSNFISPTTSM